MQIGFHSKGTKKRVLQDLAIQVEDEKEKYDKQCRECQVPVYNDQGLVYTDETKKFVKHNASPLPNKTAAKLLDGALKNVIEQLEHVGDGEEVQVSFQLTVHRPEPK